MTPRERIKKAMDVEIPDRVPYWCLLSLEHIITHGMKDHKQPRTIEELVEAEIKLTQQYNFDGGLIYLPGDRENANIESFVSRSISDIPVGESTNDFDSADPEKWELEIPDWGRRLPFSPAVHGGKTQAQVCPARPP